MLTRKEALALHSVTGEELRALQNEAAYLRDKAWGKVATYSRKVFIPLTNMCRDTCSYCTFVQAPGSPNARVMTPDEVMRNIHQAERMGCKEALFSLGEKPELKHQEARDALDGLGYSSMVDYLAAMCERVITESNLVPHVNAGTLSSEDIARLKPVSASMGMMLENISRRLIQKGQVHYACPDKVPVQRLRTLERAGQQQVPFTTGILIGIGETWEERVDSLMAINDMHRRYGHIQEVIVQNFRAKAGTAMANFPEPGLDDMLRTLAVSRLLLDPSISLQAPPNLHEHYAHYLASGINDWGGVSPLSIDYINPERAWPQIEELQQESQRCGYQLQERLTVYSRFMQEPSHYLHPRIASRIQQLARADGLAAVQCL